MRRILLVGLLAMVVPPTLTGAAAGAATDGTTTRVSVSSSGEQANSDSRGSSISADGRYVAFVSGASNLVPGDTNNKCDMFLRDRVAGTTSRVRVQQRRAGQRLQRQPLDQRRRPVRRLCFGCIQPGARRHQRHGRHLRPGPGGGHHQSGQRVQ